LDTLRKFKFISSSPQIIIEGVLLKKLEDTGYWWLPQDPDNIFLGNIKYTPGERAVLILSDFSERASNIIKSVFDTSAFDNPEDYKLILGVLSNGKKITLFKNHAFHSTGNQEVGSENVYILSFKSKYVFIGHHFEHEKDIRFKRVSVQYSFLDEWVNKVLSIPDKKTFFNKIESIPLTKKGDFKFFVDFEKTSPFFSFRELTIKQTAYLRVESLKLNNSWAEFEDMIWHMQNFFTLAISKPVHIIKIQAKIKNDKKRKIFYNGHMLDDLVRFANIDIYITHLKVPEINETVSADEMLFSYPEIKSTINKNLLNWLVNSSLFKGIFNTYFGTILKEDIMFLENQFLNIITTIESFHRSNSNNIEIEEYLHQRRINSIIDNTPAEYKDWLSIKLLYSNEPTLRVRTHEIMFRYLEIFKSKRRIDSFITKVVDARNYIVHPSSNREIEFEQLLYSTQMLKIVFELYLLENMGFKKEKINEIIKRRKDKEDILFKYFRMNE